MIRHRLFLDFFKGEVSKAIDDESVDDLNTLSALDVYLGKVLIPKLKAEFIGWQSISTFWPPRLINGYQNDELVCFFGAGLSIPSGIPSWDELLTKSFGLNQSLLTDDELKSDPLTLAELASHQIGSDQLQVILRKRMKKIQNPSTTHFASAALRLPFYITTNYDSLFENAWKILNPEIELITLVNDADLEQLVSDGHILKPNSGKAYLLKIHGCVNRLDEHLILTRSDYRLHYRTNRLFFQLITHLISKYHILFLGFSHKDPEVTRIVEDAIYSYEKTKLSVNGDNDIKKPNLYSLQFNMVSHTPEIFAARGILALNPPVVWIDGGDLRSSALAQALADLIGAADKNSHTALSLDKCLEESSNKINSELQEALNKMVAKSKMAISSLNGDTSSNHEWLDELRDDLGTLAGQGIYLLNGQGRIKKMALPIGLDKDARCSQNSFNERPYFRHARTFRKPFISDSTRSVFNGLSTFFICVPLMVNGAFIGLLFSACQIGCWDTPCKIAKDILNLNKDLSVILIDSNGVCLITPNNEFELEKSLGAQNKESLDANFGYMHDKLVRLSRRDKLVSRIMQNVVPLGQDDDLLSLGDDLKYYTVVTELESTRWKFGISAPIMLVD